jgi:hypothetical protein
MEHVQVIPLDQLALPSVSLIKIDVEGMEHGVLEGARETIRLQRPVLFVENNKKEKSADLLHLLFELGYRCWWHFEPYYNPRNIFNNPHNIFAGVGRPEINLLCLPRERHPVAAAGGLREAAGPDEDWETAWAATMSRGVQNS